MRRTFNMGLGLVMCVAERDADSVQRSLEASGETVQRVGRAVNYTTGPRVILK